MLVLEKTGRGGSPIAGITTLVEAGVWTPKSPLLYIYVPREQASNLAVCNHITRLLPKHFEVNGALRYIMLTYALLEGSYACFASSSKGSGSSSIAAACQISASSHGSKER